MNFVVGSIVGRLVCSWNAGSPPPCTRSHSLSFWTLSFLGLDHSSGTSTVWTDSATQELRGGFECLFSGHRQIATFGWGLVTAIVAELLAGGKERQRLGRT